MATIYDVARRAEVSPATVSRVVNGHSNVDPGLAERVRNAMRELGYRPNAVARNLRRSRTNLWGVIISDITNPFFTSLVRGIEDVAQQQRFSVVLCNTDGDIGKEDRYVNAALTEQVAGVIITPSDGPKHVTRLTDARVPVVVIDQLLPDADVDTVLVDNADGAERATAHLITAGYQRIACITGPADLYTADQRLAGYRRALRTHGLPYDPALVRYADFRESGGHRAMSSLLAEAAPDAVFTTNNMMTIGALQCLSEAGLEVPADIAVAAFDDIPWAHLVRPALTTVSQPTYDLGRSAAELLIARIDAPGRNPATVTLPTQLHVRESTHRESRPVSPG